MKKKFISAVSLAAVLTGVSGCRIPPEVKVAESVPLEIGDVVYTRIDNPLYREVAKTTLSWVSHVGVIVDATPGAEVVAESTVPFSKLTPLKMFIGRSKNGMYAIKRPEISLTDEQKQRLLAEVNARLGKWYHLGFKYDSKREFCSKFVYDVYLESCGLEVGHIRTLRELLADNPSTPQWFWRAWYFGFIPWNRRTITPADQYRAEHWITVAEYIPVIHG